MTDWSNVPDVLLRQEGTKPLRSWLANRGLTMTLLDLDRERRRRGFLAPAKTKTMHDHHKEN